MINSIEQLNTDTILLIIEDEKTAKQCLKKNPRADVTKAEDDGRYGLVYNIKDINMLNAIKRA